MCTGEAAIIIHEQCHSLWEGHHLGRALRLDPQAGKGLDEDAQRGAWIPAEMAHRVRGAPTAADRPSGRIQVHGHRRHVQAAIPREC